MNGYAIADGILLLLEVGVSIAAVRDRLAAERAKGTPESEVPGLLQQWRDEAIADAKTAKPAA